MGMAGRAKVESEFNLETLSGELADLLADFPARGRSGMKGRAVSPYAESEAGVP
ncbi:hypothetical protein D3C83_335360 [compost metagenome]